MRIKIFHRAMMAGPQASCVLSKMMHTSTFNYLDRQKIQRAYFHIRSLSAILHLYYCIYSRLVLKNEGKSLFKIVPSPRITNSSITLVSHKNWCSASIKYFEICILSIPFDGATVTYKPDDTTIIS